MKRLINNYGDWTEEGHKVFQETKHMFEQIITYCVLNNIKPFYYFGQDTVNVIDCSDIEPKVIVTEDKYRRVSYKTTENLQKQAEFNKALSKLSDKEKHS